MITPVTLTEVIAKIIDNEDDMNMSESLHFCNDRS